MLVRASQGWLLVLLTGLRTALRRTRRSPRVKRAPKHALNAHSESVYVWSLFERNHGSATSQEMRQQAANERGSRSRTNGFVTVTSVLARGEQ